MTKIAAAEDLSAALEAGWSGHAIARRLSLADVAEAHDLVESGRAGGRCVLDLSMRRDPRPMGAVGRFAAATPWQVGAAGDASASPEGAKQHAIARAPRPGARPAASRAGR